MFGFGTYLVGGVFEPDVWEALFVGERKRERERERERKRKRKRERERERERERIGVSQTARKSAS